MPNSSELINEIREQADIVSIISSYIPLEKKGKNYFAVCPFHDDHNPSMSVSADKQIYKCFVCGASGNVFSFVKDYENVSFLEAVKIVADHVGINFNTPSIKTSPKKNKRELELMEFVCKYYQLNLNSKDGLNALKYLKNRHIDEKNIEEFKIGLSLKKLDNLTQILKQKGYDIDLLEKLGISYKNNNDIFINRIMFPLCDEDGQVIGFSARIYNNEKDQSKYINTKETILFKKGNFLYNYHIAKKEVKRSKKLIIVEGQMDVIRLCSVGIKNCIALSGTALTSEQVKLIKKLKVPVYLVLDNDNAGGMATYNNGLILDQNNIDVKVVRLTKTKDPDEFIIKYGKEDFEKYLNSPISYLSFKINYLKKNKNLKETKDLVKYINEILDSLKNEKDDLTIEIVLKKLSKEYDLDYYNLLNKLKDNKSHENKILTEKKESKDLKEKKKNKYVLASEAIIYFMLQDPIYIKMYQKKLGYLSKKEHRDLVNEILYFYEINSYINMADFISFIQEKNLNEDVLKEIIIDNDKVKISEGEMENYINVVEEGLIKEKITKLKKELKEEVSEVKKLDIVKEITRLKKGV